MLKMPAGFNSISVYSRASAIDDGVLIDVTPAARIVGFPIPVAMTIAAWDDCLTGSDDNTPLEENQRLRDVLRGAIIAAKLNGDKSVLGFDVACSSDSGETSLITLTMHIGPGDEGEPVVTIMLPGED